ILTQQRVIIRHLDPLPPGYFYNGCQYVDIFGEKRNFHPNMEDFIKAYIAEANKEIEIFNRQLELQGQPDLFDP
uniref:Dynein axonemal assembly factor 9 n=1 Tax=Seriola dumerili TaxID=41447 RepID=A0A3B4TB16_SERDU